MTPFSINWNTDGSAIVRGEFDLSVVEQATHEFSQIVPSAERRFDIDVRPTDFVDSAALLVLLNLRRRLGLLRIITKEASQPSRILRVSGYDKEAFRVERVVE